MPTDSNLLETIILYLALAAFAYFGATSLAPKAAEVLQGQLIRAAGAGGGVSR